jgi:hypothetical protein
MMIGFAGVGLFLLFGGEFLRPFAWFCMVIASLLNLQRGLWLGTISSTLGIWNHRYFYD